MTDWTSVRVSTETKTLVEEHQRRDESKDDVIRRLAGDDPVADRVARLEDRVAELEAALQR